MTGSKAPFVKRVLSTEEVVDRVKSGKHGSMTNLRLAASVSFNEAEVSALDEVLSTLLRGGDVTVMRKSKALISIAGKIPGMKASVERNRARRAAVGR